MVMRSQAVWWLLFPIVAILGAAQLRGRRGETPAR